MSTPTGWGTVMVSTRLEKMVENEFFVDWTRLVAQGLREGDRYQIATGKTAHMGANSLIQEFLKTDCDSMLFIDSDAGFTPQSLSVLRDFEEGWDYDILQAFYTRRGWPPEAIWFKKDDNGLLHRCLVLEDTTEEVEFVGFHFTLIKREILLRMLGDEKPEDKYWVYYPRGPETEDVMFCRDARAVGARIGATTYVKTTHIGHLSVGWESYQDYLAASNQLEQVERYDKIVKMLASYFNLSNSEVINQMAKGYRNVKEDWDKLKLTEPKEIRDFYGNEEGYFFDLGNWNYSKYYVERTAPLKTVKNQKVLVIGAGLGEEVNLMVSPEQNNEIWIYELPGKLRDFLHYRFPEEEYPHVHFLDEITFVTAVWETNWTEHFDLVVAMDVIEHIHPKEIQGFMINIKRILKVPGLFYAHINYNPTDKEKYPMHFLETEEKVMGFLKDNFSVYAENLIWRKER